MEINKLDSVENNLLKKFEKQKNNKLLLSILVDSVGLLSYVVPTFGESIDLVWAPVSSAIIYAMFKTDKKKAFTGSIINFVEEIIPFTDFIPTSLSLWFYTYVIKQEETKKKYIISENKE